MRTPEEIAVLKNENKNIVKNTLFAVRAGIGRPLIEDCIKYIQNAIIIEIYDYYNNKKTEYQEHALGLYKIYWKMGGFSYASIYMDESDQCIAPCNWVKPAKLKLVYDNIKSFELIQRA